MDQTSSYTAFAGTQKIASGTLADTLRTLKEWLEQPSSAPAQILIFHDESGKPIDFDLRGSLGDVLERAGLTPGPVRPGRPKLGVTAREVTLLPRHWEWLEAQRGGASAALRRLVDEARKQNSSEDRIRQTLEAVGTFMTTLSGDLPEFEEATRALYARNLEQLESRISYWPQDVRDYVLTRVREVLSSSSSQL